YTGDSLDELKTNVMRGPIVDDAIPNAIKPIIRRALATKPDERWTSMTVMLDALEAALGRRKRRIRLAAALAIGAAGTIGLVALRSHDTTIVDCSPPALDLAVVWSPARVATVGQRDAESAKRIAADVDSWRAERDRACIAPPATRSSKLACLDGVLARIDLAARAFERPGLASIEGTSTILVDPAVCAHDPPPHLTTPIDPELAAALDEFRVVREGGPDSDPPASNDACTRSLQLRARIGALGRKQLEIPDVSRLFEMLKATSKVVDHCNDDAIRAEVLLGASQHSSPEVTRTEAAVAAVPAEDYIGEADFLRGDLVAASSFDAAMASYEHALDRLSRRHHPRFQLRVAVAMQQLLLSRSRTADVQRVIELGRRWRQGASPADQEYLDQRVAAARWRLGDVDAADELAWRVGPPINQTDARASPLQPRDVSGVVVDDAGHPVAGAEVVVSDNVDAGAAPLTLRDNNRTRTDAHGAFTLTKARGYAVAWTSDQRSAFILSDSPSLRLVVHPTVTIAGKVALGSLDPTQLRVTLTSTDAKLPFDEIAPVRADGSFEMRHALPGKMTIVAREYGVDTGDAPAPLVVTGTNTNVSITAHPARPLDIVTRNTGVSALDVAVVFVFTGRAPGSRTTLHTIGRNFDALVQATSGQAIPDDVRGTLQPDDLYVKLRSRPSGPLFVCTAGMTRDMFSILRSEEVFVKAFSTAELGCADVAADQSLVVVE
ncbi:MAG TPA: carboxypeptidase-like regulatory domain-containing protein, partial [Kofleriaceae bacterium]|nr:carboxypeptidase-like regulatory domain-containing protein [Kofleriaceae bacterium]